jgi:hypothetical protein
MTTALFGPGSALAGTRSAGVDPDLERSIPVNGNTEPRLAVHKKFGPLPVKGGRGMRR